MQGGSHDVFVRVRLPLVAIAMWSTTRARRIRRALAKNIQQVSSLQCVQHHIRIRWMMKLARKSIVELTLTFASCGATSARPPVMVIHSALVRSHQSTPVPAPPVARSLAPSVYIVPLPAPLFVIFHVHILTPFFFRGPASTRPASIESLLVAHSRCSCRSDL